MTNTTNVTPAAIMNMMPSMMGNEVMIVVMVCLPPEYAHSTIGSRFF